MSTRTRPGIGAARDLLGLIQDHSAQEIEAAEAILGNEKDLIDILRMLRRYKEHQEQQEPQERLSVERLREIVRRELLGLQLNVNAMGSVVSKVLRGNPVRTPPNATPEDVVAQALKKIEDRSDSPSDEVEDLLAVLVSGFDHARREHRSKLCPLLRDLAAQALAENVVMFPTMNDLAHLRTRWADKSLPRAPRESRAHYAERLLVDAERLAPERVLGIAQDLLREGLRGPADAEIARLRRMDRRKAHGE